MQKRRTFGLARGERLAAAASHVNTFECTWLQRIGGGRRRERALLGEEGVSGAARLLARARQLDGQGE